MAKVLKCDRCGEIYESGGFAIRDMDYINVNWKYNQKSSMYSNLDLCCNCGKKLRSMLVSFIVIGEEL